MEIKKSILGNKEGLEMHHVISMIKEILLEMPGCFK